MLAEQNLLDDSMFGQKAGQIHNRGLSDKYAVEFFWKSFWKSFTRQTIQSMKTTIAGVFKKQRDQRKISRSRNQTWNLSCGKKRNFSRNLATAKVTALETYDLNEAAKLDRNVVIGTREDVISWLDGTKSDSQSFHEMALRANGGAKILLSDALASNRLVRPANRFDDDKDSIRVSLNHRTDKPRVEPFKLGRSEEAARRGKSGAKKTRGEP